MQWFRWYHQTSADPKFGSIARKLGVPKHLVLAVWQVVLESASENDQARGLHTMDAEGAADRIGSETEQAAQVLAAFIERGMVLPDGTVTAFEKRNRKSDDVNARVKRHRNVTPAPEPVTETATQRPVREKKRSVDLDIDSVPNGTGESGASPRPMTVFDTGEAMLLEARAFKSAQSARAFVAKLCKDFGDSVVHQAVESFRGHDPPAEAKSALVAACQARKQPNGKSRHGVMFDALAAAADEP